LYRNSHFAVLLKASDSAMRYHPAAGMRLPNAAKALVEVAKLRDYCLNPAHPRGRHKARVFANVLGIRSEQAEFLRKALLEAALSTDVTLGERDAYGQRYVLDFSMGGLSGTAMVRSTWIVLSGENFARLTSCYVL
jgi:Domain of unknown function (DUF6883)